jgi:hypothetical protein
MSRTTPKLPIARGSAVPTLHITDHDWKRIESAYGHALGDALRQDVLEVTEKYLEWAGPEVTAQALAGAVSRAQDIRKAILQLHRTVFGVKKELRDADAYVRSLLRNHLSLSMRNGRCGFQQSVLDFYKSVLPACDAALRKLEAEADQGFRSGDAWKIWVRGLTKVLDKAGLPVSVRKDSDKSKADEPSPFAALVRELQACLPESLRRSYAPRPDAQSNIALSSAIALARHRGTKPAETAPNKPRRTLLRKSKPARDCTVRSMPPDTTPAVSRTNEKKVDG